MRRFALLVPLLCLAVTATAQIHSLEPARGFPWGGNLVTIHADTGWGELTNCAGECFTGNCPATVTFGDITVEAMLVYPTLILVKAPPHAAGVVDVTINVIGRPQQVKQNAFIYDAGSVTTLFDYERYLLPVVSNDIRGGQGSRWVSELTLINATDADVTLVAPWSPAPAGYASGRDARVELSTRADGGDGAFVYVPVERDDFGMQLRVRDVSRVAEGMGTDIPVVPPDDFADVIELIDVPTDSRYRAHLRIYGEPNAATSTITVYAPDGDTPLEVRSVRLHPPSSFGDFVKHPAYQLIDAITPAIRDSGLTHVRIRVQNAPESPIDETFQWRTWAMVSLTNNETQQVTLVTPHRN